MRSVYRLLTFPLFLFLVASNRGVARAEPAGDPLGKRFLCSDAPAKRLCPPAILSGCRVTLEPGPGIPSEPEEKMLLHQGNESHRVDGPNQLKGCVSISTEAQALEYLRFFSSLRTVHLFRDKVLEIYPSSGKGCYLVCLPKNRWDLLRLSSPLVKKTDVGFRVTRFVIKPVPNRQDVTVFRLTQEVGAAGTVKELEVVPVSIPKADLLWLGFPSYL